MELRVPARPEFVGVIRMALAGFAARMGVGPDDIEDFKVVVGEACTAAVLAEGRQLQVSFDAPAGSLEVRIVHAPGPRQSDTQDGHDAELLHSLVLYSLADIVQTETHEGHVVTYVAKVPKPPEA